MSKYILEDDGQEKTFVDYLIKRLRIDWSENDNLLESIYMVCLQEEYKDISKYFYWDDLVDNEISFPFRFDDGNEGNYDGLVEKFGSEDECKEVIERKLKQVLYEIEKQNIKERKKNEMVKKNCKRDSVSYEVLSCFFDIKEVKVSEEEDKQK